MCRALKSCPQFYHHRLSLRHCYSKSVPQQSKARLSGPLKTRWDCIPLVLWDFLIEREDKLWEFFFLDSYTRDSPRCYFLSLQLPALSSIGLLCRFYNGTKSHFYHILAVYSWQSIFLIHWVTTIKKISTS